MIPATPKFRLLGGVDHGIIIAPWSTQPNRELFRSPPNCQDRRRNFGVGENHFLLRLL